MFHVHVYNSLQKIFKFYKKKYCILPLSVKVLSFCKEVFKGSDKNALKDFTLYRNKKMSLP